MLLKELFEEVAKIHLNQMKYLNHINSFRLISSFSGAPRSGKTYISKILEERYKAIRINGDEINDIIISFNKEKDITNKYVEYLLRNIYVKTNNHFIILDKSIDRRHTELEEIAKQLNSKLFIIKVIAIKKKVIERILKRNINSSDYLRRLDEWINDFIRFNNTHLTNFEINNSTDVSMNLIDLFKISCNIIYIKALKFHYHQFSST